MLSWLSLRMIKAIGISLACSLLISCSLFRASSLPYPEGIVFPLENFHEVGFRGEIVERVIVREDYLYFSTRQGFVYGFEGKERRLVWQSRVSRTLESPVYLGEESLYVYDAVGILYSLDLKGKLKWKREFAEKLSGGVCEDRGMVFVGMPSGKLWALKSDNGAHIWVFDAGGAIETDPIAILRGIIFGCSDHYLYMIGRSGRLLSRFLTGDAIKGGLLADSRYVYFGSYDHYFYCIDSIRSKIKWKIKTGGKIHGYPMSDGKRIFFIAMNNVLYCLNKKGGTILWWNKVPARSFYGLQLIDDRIIATGLSSRIVCFGATTGKDKGSFDLPSEAGSNAIWMDPYLVVALFDESDQAGRIHYLGKQIKLALNSSKKSPQKENEEIVFTATPTGFHQPFYEFSLGRLARVRFGFSSFIFIESEHEEKLSQEKSEDNTFSWFPEESGIYVICVKVTDEREEAKTEMPFLIEEEKKEQEKQKESLP